MSNTPNQYEELNDFNQIAERLLDRYPEIFSDRKIDKIAAVSLLNKDRSEKKKQIWEIKPVVPPITLFCHKEYVVTFYASDWISMSDEHKALAVADVLLSISSEGQGKTVPFDLKDHSVMLRTFGVDYLSRPDIPNILDRNIEWKIIENSSGEDVDDND
jgi:hypothetical protein